MSAIHPHDATATTLQIPAAALGSRASRAAAIVVDSIVLLIPAFFVGLLAGHATGSAFAIVWILASILYAPLMLARAGEHNGQTVGKQLLSLRVVTTAGVPVTIGVGLKRHLLGQTLLSAFTFGLYGLLDYAWPLWDDRKQTLHDKIGGTYVFQASADPGIARELGAPIPPRATVAASPPPPPPPPSGIPTA